MIITVITPIKPPPGSGEQSKDDRILAAAGPQTEIRHIYAPDTPDVIESEYEDALAVPSTVRVAVEAQRNGADAIVINCTADTGLAACRECVSIPVVAPTLAAMHLAAQLAHRFSVLTFLERINERFEEMAWRWGLHHRLASVRSVEIPVLELADNSGALAERLFEAALQCYRDDGAHALILGCTDFEVVSQQVSALLQEAGTPVLLIEPYVVAVRQAEALVSMGIGHSKLTYPFPKKSTNL